MSRDEMDSLLNEAIDTSLYFLKKIGEFFPFAVGITTESEIRHIHGYLNEERPASDDVIQMLQNSLKYEVQNGNFHAIAIISDIKLTDSNTDKVVNAIRANIEHKNSNPITCYLPYEIEDGAVSTDKIIALPGPSVFF